MPAGIGYENVVGLSPDKRAEFEAMPSGLASLVETAVPIAGVNPNAMPGPLKLSNPHTAVTGASTLTKAGQQDIPRFAQGGLVPAAAGAPAQAAAPASSAAPTPVGLPQMEAEAQRLAQQNPEVMQQIQQALQQALTSGNLTPQQLNMAIEMAKAAAQNPELYPRLRDLAVQQGLVDEDELPPQYDPGIVMALITAGTAIQQQGGAAPAPAAAPAAARRAAPRLPDAFVRLATVAWQSKINWVCRLGARDLCFGDCEGRS